MKYYKVIANIEKQIEYTIEAETKEEAIEIVEEDWNCLSNDSETETLIDIEVYG